MEIAKVAFSKPARNADFLLKQLRDRGVVITEEKILETKFQIRSIGYFRLSGYFGPLQDAKDHFKEGTTFDDILRLYLFDKKLKVLVSDLLGRFEIELRTSLTDVLSLSKDSFWYVNADLFKEDTTDIDNIECIIDEEGNPQKRDVKTTVKLYDLLIGEIKRSTDKQKDSAFIKAFYEKYDANCPIPSWMMMESISFGKLSRLYWLLKALEEKVAITKKFGALTSDHFTSWLHAFVILRNRCAHHGRLWNRKIKDVKIPRRPTKKFISCTNLDNLRMFYGVSSCLLQVFTKIDAEKGAEFKVDFFNLVEEHDIDLAAMGFPKDWSEDVLWKNS